MVVYLSSSSCCSVIFNCFLNNPREDLAKILGLLIAFSNTNFLSHFIICWWFSFLLGLFYYVSVTLQGWNMLSNLCGWWRIWNRIQLVVLGALFLLYLQVLWYFWFIKRSSSVINLLVTEVSYSKLNSLSIIDSNAASWFDKPQYLLYPSFLYPWLSCLWRYLLRNANKGLAI